ncbi:cbb3-type cytochrome c oxidase subunit 3 [Melioribacter sp. OK-6-Me]|uniref:cbb3-type cytochrome c oxidase subunit 3 n=1 Tax=unclassified Melioribacter TaxID=2627329 RepID=UPI003EDB6AB9
MISNYLSSIDGVSVYPIISLIIFFSVFIITIIRTWKLDKNFIEKMKNLPLNNSQMKNNSEINNE